MHVAICQIITRQNRFMSFDGGNRTISYHGRENEEVGRIRWRNVGPRLLLHIMQLFCEQSRHYLSSKATSHAVKTGDQGVVIEQKDRAIHGINGT